MPSHAELASRLLTDAASFFRTLAEQNQPIRTQMTENATVFEQMAAMLTQNPLGMLEDKPVAELTGRLLKDAATFFRALAEQNPPLKEQMTENANIYDRIAELVTQNPTGILE